MVARRLRAVTPDDKPAVKPLTVVEAADRGDHRALLVALRSRLAKAVQSEDTSPRDLAALTRRLADVNAEIRALDLAAQQDAGADGAAPDADFDASAV